MRPVAHTINSESTMVAPPKILSLMAVCLL
jgi:hypothetical protein